MSASDRKISSVVIDILGKIWAAPMTAVGLIAGGTLNLIGKLSGKDVSFEFANNAFSFDTRLNLGGAITLGNVIIYAAGDSDDGKRSKNYDIPRYDFKKDDSGEYIMIKLGDHEEEHTYQYQKYGIFMMPVLIGSAIKNGGIKESSFRDFMGSSSLEKAADDHAESRKIIK